MRHAQEQAHAPLTREQPMILRNKGKEHNTPSVEEVVAEWPLIV